MVGVSRVSRYLFKYASPERIWETLDSGLVYFADPQSFNDPYDSLIPYAQNREDMERKARKVFASIQHEGVSEAEKERKLHLGPLFHNWESINREMSEGPLKDMNLGVCCLSGTHTSFPMWAHYAKNHTGGCLVFNFAHEDNKPAIAGNFPFSLVLPVKYRKELPIRGRKVPHMESVQRYLATKSQEWEYECEWRALMIDHRKSRSGGTPEHFQGVGKYHHGGALVGVILGDKTPLTLRWMIHRLASDRNFAVWQARIKTGEYGLDIEPCNVRAEKRKFARE